MANNPNASGKLPAVLFGGLVVFLAAVGYFVGRETMGRKEATPVLLGNAAPPLMKAPNAAAPVESPPPEPAAAPERGAATSRVEATPPIEQERARADHSDDERDADRDAVAERDAEEIRIRELRNSARGGDAPSPR